MSVNHYLSSGAFWWSKQQHYNNNITMESSSNNTNNNVVNFDLNNDDEDSEENLTEERDQVIMAVPKDHLFEKPLTPSDVGKLNRLVIPKQHAEKYFPLTGQDSSAAAAGEKGCLLSFEDESGKVWRFRYSYWNSSQSYVLTKGWSRFVKEKRLDAGDVVLFQRHSLDGDRLFIGWRRRNAGATAAVHEGGVAAQPNAVVGGGGGGGWGGQVYFTYPPAVAPPYQPEYLHAGASVAQSQTPSSGSSKTTLRLFGVNMECEPADETEPATPDGSTTSSQGQTGHHYLYQYYSTPLASYTHTQDLNFSRDVNQMRYHQG